MAIGLGVMLSAASSIYTGIETFKASNALASDLRFEGEILFREAFRTANIIEEEGRKFAANQSLQFIGSGVQIAGSALVTLAQTKKFAETEAKAVRARGAATKSLAEKKADRAQNEGRASLISGIIGGAGSLITASK